MRAEVDLYGMSLEDVGKKHRELGIILDARNMLADIIKVISEAGGQVSEEELSSLTLGDFAAIAARNSLAIKVESLRPCLSLVGSEDFGSEEPDEL